MVGFKWAEGDGVDDRWKLMETGPFFSGTIVHPGGPTIKGLVVKLGDRVQAAVCYDTQLLRVSCGWSGGFLNFSPARYGLISPPVINGKAEFTSPPKPGCTPTGHFDDPRSNRPYGPLPEEFAHYEGLSLHGSRVALRYTVGSVKIVESPWAETSESALLITREFNVAASDRELKILLTDGKSSARLVGKEHAATINHSSEGHLVLVIPAHSQPLVLKVAIWSSEPAKQAGVDGLLKKSPAAIDPVQWTTPGERHWGDPLVTQGELAKTKPGVPVEPYVIDTLTIPFKNRFNALMFLSGHDFFANGDAAVCTAHGDVWLVGGINESLEKLTWRRFATGLFQPLGLKIVKQPDGQEFVYVLGRDQITLLHDRNQDGEADDYVNFNNAGQATANSHEFATCLETDSRGNFYYLRGDSGSQTQHDGCLLKVSADGKRLDVFATGFRNANGLGIGPDDTITVAPQEGTWTPGSAIFPVREGGFYGAMQAHHRAVPPTTYDPPICWIPRQQDNSSGGQAWVTSKRWGPLEGQLLHFSFGTCRMYLALRETVGNSLQGGTIQFPFTFDSGVMRGRFHPQDGQLYVTGLKGWVSSAVQDGCFQRVRYTGQPVDMPVAMKTYSNGVALTFTSPLRKSDAEDPDNYSVEQWNYLWSGNYGSPDLRVSNPNQVGHDEVEVVSSTLLADGKSVFIEMPNLKRAMQVAISYTISNAQGKPIRQTLNATLHVLDQVPQPEKLVRRPRPGQLPPDVERNLKPGLLLTKRNLDNDEPDTIVVSRLAAALPDSNTDGREKLQQLTWTGYLRVPQKAEYRFRCTPLERLSIDGRAIAPETATALGRGYHTIEVIHDSQPARITPGQTNMAARHPTQVRILWKADGIPWEAIPPSSLFHSDNEALTRAQTIRDGRDAFVSRSCANCHALPKTDSAPIEIDRRAAPVLEQVGRRLNPDWLAAWIERPDHLRPEARMPSLIHSVEKKEQSNQKIADLIAYLCLTSDPSSPIVAHSPAATDPQLVETGRQLYQAQGCMGCHRFTPPSESDNYHRQSLHFVAAKFRPGTLAEFLRSPQRHYQKSRMPDFHFSDSEADALEAFLRSEAKGNVAQRPGLPRSDAKRGEQLFQELGCQQCHATQSESQTMAVSLPVATRNSKLWGTKEPAGCLLPHDPSSAKSRPDYHFESSERDAVHAFLSTSERDPFPLRDRHDTQSLIRQLNCAACHSRDGKNSPLAEIVADEGDGRPVESVPHLTWTGEKLQRQWMERLFAGTLKQKTRPFLKARMPAFPAYAGELAEGLLLEHGIRSDVSVQQPVVNPELADLGQQLMLKTKGLDCRQCHGVGAEQPSGDKATLISPGINFSITAERMNLDFLPQLLLNPPRYDPSTRMPVFAVDGQTTAAKGILDGDAIKQFEAIREYLRTVPALK